MPDSGAARLWQERAGGPLVRAAIPDYVRFRLMLRGSGDRG